MNIIRSDVREALASSLLEVEREDPLDIDLLSPRPLECIASFVSNEEDDPALMRLQTTNTAIPGFHVEASAGFQAFHGSGAVSNGTNQQGLIHDVCAGLGPTDGGATGFLLQIFLPVVAEADTRNIQNVITDYGFLNEGAECEIDPNRLVSLFHFLFSWVDLDAALGPALGAAHGCGSGLFSKFGLVLACSACVLGLQATAGLTDL